MCKRDFDVELNSSLQTDPSTRKIYDEQEDWLAANRSEISSKIEEGYAAAQRGELIDADEVRLRIAERKRARPELQPTENQRPNQGQQLKRTPHL